MKLYLYRGLQNEIIPHPRIDYTHAIVHESVTVIRKVTLCTNQIKHKYIIAFYSTVFL